MGRHGLGDITDNGERVSNPYEENSFIDGGQNQDLTVKTKDGSAITEENAKP